MATKLPRQLTVWPYRRWRRAVLRRLPSVPASMTEGDLIALWIADVAPQAAAEKLAAELREWPE